MRHTTGEGLDDGHGATAAAAARLLIGSPLLGRRRRLRVLALRSEKRADLVDVGGANGTGEQAIVPDAVEALGQDVE